MPVVFLVVTLVRPATVKGLFVVVGVGVGVVVVVVVVVVDVVVVEVCCTGCDDTPAIPTHTNGVIIHT